MGAGAFKSYFCSLLAAALAEATEYEKAIQAIAAAMSHARSMGEQLWEPELYRQRGELLLLSSADISDGYREVENCLNTAIDMARALSSKSLELRAAMSLSRLWQRLGETAKAREVLAEPFGWFTEGFETPDLRDARALLTELGN